MKIKKIICLLIAVCCLFLSFAQAESPSVIGFSIRNDGGSLRLLALSPVFPDGERILATYEEAPGLQGVFSLLRPDSAFLLLDCLKQMIVERNKAHAGCEKGLYSGDLFDLATEKELFTLDAAGLKIMMGELADRVAGLKGAEAGESVRLLLANAVGELFSGDTKALFTTFDQNRFLSVEILRGQETVMTFSADLSVEDACTLVLGRGAGDAAFYEKASFERNETGIRTIHRLYRTAAPSFRMTDEAECVLSGDFLFSAIRDEAYAFDGEIRTILLPYPMAVKGSKTAGKEEISAEITCGESDEAFTGDLLLILNRLLQP